VPRISVESRVLAAKYARLTVLARERGDFTAERLHMAQFKAVAGFEFNVSTGDSIEMVRFPAGKPRRWLLSSEQALQAWSMFYDVITMSNNNTNKE
jgi:hypothetical protein